MKRNLASIIAVLVTLVSSTAFAWGPAGHKTVAAIAFRQLKPQEQKKIVEMLKHHPRFEEDFENRMPDNVDENEWIFQQAAVWPDMARGLKGDERKEFHRPEWHFIDIPYFPTDDDKHELEGHLSLNLSYDPPGEESEDMNLVQATRFAQRVLADSHASKSDKAKYLSWLFHLAGDAHQPLHAATLCVVDLFPEGDHGGNWIPTEQSHELHALWDGFPGSPRIKFREVQQRALKLMRDREFKHAGEKATNDLNVVTWVKESRELAEQVAYTSEVLTSLEGETDRKKLEPIDLSDEYLSTGGKTAQRRLVEGGYRLGAILTKIAQ